MELKGMDISNAQGNVNFQEVKNSDIDFVIIRCGWGSDSAKQDDPKFNTYISECERVGLDYGVYLYSYALNLDSAKSEAQHMLRLLNGRKPKYGVWYDMEDGDHYKQKHGMNVYQSRQLITDMCKTFCDIINSNGYDCGIYAAYDYWKNVMYKDQLAKYPMWLAIWGPSKPPIPCRMWQYTSTGHVNGIAGNVDLDIYYTDAVIAKDKTKVINAVKELQKALNEYGNYGLVIDGIIGPLTTGAYQNFRKD